MRHVRRRHVGWAVETAGRDDPSFDARGIVPAGVAADDAVEQTTTATTVAAALGVVAIAPAQPQATPQHAGVGGAGGRTPYEVYHGIQPA